MWSVTYDHDPLQPQHNHNQNQTNHVIQSQIANLTCPITALLSPSSSSDNHDAAAADDDDDDDTKLSQQAVAAFQEGKRSAQVALADYMARILMQQLPLPHYHRHYHNHHHSHPSDISTIGNHNYKIHVEMLDQMATALESRTPANADFGMPMSMSNNNMEEDAPAWQRKSMKRKKKRSSASLPYILERTDVWCNDVTLHMTLRVLWIPVGHSSFTSTTTSNNSIPSSKELHEAAKPMLDYLFQHYLLPPTSTSTSSYSYSTYITKIMSHISSHVLQDKIRTQLSDKHALNAVSFLTNGSILPRQSGTSTKPMASPPAIPLMAPSTTSTATFDSTEKSLMKTTVSISVGKYLGQFIHIPECYQSGMKVLPSSSSLSCDKDQMDMNTHSEWIVKLTGLLVPRGVTLIVGGGYHGKSTLLRAIALGIHNKIPGDGREYCITTRSALTIRAEDGRYVQNCNISAFISNLPFSSKKTSSNPNPEEKEHENSSTSNNTAVTVTANITATAASSESKPKLAPATQSFSTKEASGSTSQATNVSEAIEMGATALLVDEDISAANFMARDGRMRSLVADESITPLLYRVNGLYNSNKLLRGKQHKDDTEGISTVVVVGGVGDWLDVPHHVILMDKYRIYDATKKAKSVSEAFSHGHIQYGGRGVVHRLEWDDEGTPMQRRPLVEFKQPKSIANTTTISSIAAITANATKDKKNEWGMGVMVSVQAGGSRLYMDPIDIETNYGASVHHDETHKNDDDSDSDSDDEDYDEDKGVIDMSRCEQLFGSTHELYGCGICLAWLLKYASEHPKAGTQELLERLDEVLDEPNGGGMKGLQSLNFFRHTKESIPTMWSQMTEQVGFAYRPRRYEVAMALTRMRGVTFENVPSEGDYGSEAAATKLEAERKKQELLAIWNARRKPKRFNEQFK